MRHVQMNATGDIMTGLNSLLASQTTPFENTEVAGGDESKEEDIQRHHLEVNSQNSQDHDDESEGSEDEDPEDEMLESGAENYDQVNDSNQTQYHYRVGPDGGRYKRDGGYIDGHQMSADYY